MYFICQDERYRMLFPWSVRGEAVGDRRTWRQDVTLTTHLLLTILVV